MFFTRNTAFFASNETLCSVSSTSSTSALAKKTSIPAPQKDYFAALGNLQNQYGFGGSAPTPVTLPKASKWFKSKSKKSKVQTRPAESSSKSERDYEAAYGALCSSYGFGGALAPTPTSLGKTSRLNEK